MKKILILTANPKNTDQLRLGEEVREIQVGLERAKRRNEFEIMTRSAVRVDDLRRALLDYDPQIVHFSGHGAGEQGLVLENDSGQMQLVSTGALTNLFHLFQDKIECVVLNACYSEEQAKAIHQHIDCVVGMNKAIGDRAAIEFAVGFYDALGAGRSYDQAYKFGCSAIDLENIPESLTPVLKVRSRYRQPWLENASDQPLVPSSTVAPPTLAEKPSQSLSISGGTISGQVAQVGGNATQIQQITRSSIEPQLTSGEIAETITAIATLLQDSTLPDPQKHKATTHLEAAKAATQETEPDKDYAAKSLQKVLNLLKNANESIEVSQGLWTKVVPLVKQLLPWLGVTSHFFGF